ncbi:MAG: 50S ribosomal protein L16 [Candidatus Buchananbacteria bacterium]
MLAPRKTKHRKWHRPDIKGNACRKRELSFGSFGLRAVTGGWVSARQIEAARRAMTRFIKRNGKVWIRIFPDWPITQKGSQSTMGGGKGVPEYYVAKVLPGTVMFEMDGVAITDGREAMRLASHKLSVRTKFITKQD